MKGFYSPIDQLAAQLPRTKGTGAEFMTELSKRPGYKPQEAQDRDLQTLMTLPKMERAQFLAALKAKPAPQLEESTLAESVLKNRGLNVLPDEPTKYHEYTLPGGSNYREILLQMPHDSSRRADPSSGHWDQPNVLAHVRAKDRTGPNGEKILHIEEIQSDWHQRGRDKGYLSPDMPKQLEAAKLAHQRLKEQLEYAKSSSSADERKLKSDMPLYQDPVVRQRVEASMAQANNLIMDLMPQVMKAEAARQELEQKAKYGVPDAPFKKNWHELALKKMIHHAAEKGYDAIAITPGAEQADRYNLSKHIGMVSYHPSEQRFQAFKPNRETVINEKGATPERVAELIGKDAAERLMKAPKAGDHHYLEGENLNIGGEGMKGFYDKMVPSFLNQFGKKYGAQVGTIPVAPNITEGEIYDKYFGEVHDAMRSGDLGAQRFIAKKMAEINKPVPMHHFPITPQMREDVTKNGVPLYAEGGSIKPKAERDANLAQFLKDSAVKDRLYHSTNSNISSFKTNMPSSNNYGFLGDAPVTRSAVFLTPNYKFSQKYLREGHGQNVMPVHASIKKPFDLRHGLTEKQEAELEAAGVNTRYVHNTTPWELFDNDENNQNYLVDTLKKLGYDSAVFHEHSPSGTGQAQTTYAVFHPHQIKSAIGNRGTYDPNEVDITKAKGGSIKPIGYTKEKVTVSPNLDAMRYELMSVKHFAKKVK